MSAAWGSQPRRVTRRRRTLLIIAGALWLLGAWATRHTDSDTGAPTSSAAARHGEEMPAAEVQTWQGPHHGRSLPVRASRHRRPPSAGTLPAVLLRIRWCESRNDYKAEEPRSTASGAWQILDGTWNGYRGYHHASAAPRHIQDAKALALYRDRGTKPWKASRRCWS